MALQDLAADDLSLTSFRPRQKKAASDTTPDPAARRRALLTLIDAFPEQAYDGLLSAVVSEARLSPLEATVLKYRLDGLSLTEVAVVLERRPGTIHSVAARVEKKLVALRRNTVAPIETEP